MIAPPLASAGVKKSQIIQFQNQGFFHIPQLLSPEMTKRLKDAYTRAEEEQINPRRLTEGRSFYDVRRLLETDAVFSELAILPELIPYLLATIGEDVQLVETCARLFPPGKTFTAPWHSDLAEVLGINLAESPNFYIKVHFYFEDLQPNQGCLAFLPGSHRLPREAERPRPEDIDPATDAAVIVPKAGDAVLFNTHCMHMCLDNETDQDRRTLIYAYSHFWVKQFPNAIPTDKTVIPDRQLERQIFGISAPGVKMWDQRPTAVAKPSRLDQIRERIGKKILSGLS